MSEQTTEAQEHDDDLSVEFSSWEFYETPTPERVRDMLKRLPDWWGLRPEDYIDFIQPLSQSKNLSQDKTRKDYRTVWTLYVTVAGRLAMIRDAAVMQGWKVDFEPEQNTPTGIPGMIQYDENRIVYREYCVIYAPVGGIRKFPNHDRSTTEVHEWRELGRKPGVAWVPTTGGSGAVASNRYEKVETAARGRAIAAWGFGVLPGSGVASLEEMQGMNEMRQAVREERDNQRQTGQRKSKGDLEGELRERLVEFQQLSQSTDEEMDRRVQSYCEASFNKRPEKNDKGAWDFSILQPGEVVLFRNRMSEEVQRIKNEKGI